MLKRTTILFLLFTFYFVSNAQTDSLFAPFKKIKGDIAAFAADNFDNLYLLNSYDQLKKIDANGDSVAVFNNVRRYGKVAQLDVTNPLRVLLYYKDFSTVVILDRLLSVRSTIDLRKQDVFQDKRNKFDHSQQQPDKRNEINTRSFHIVFGRFRTTFIGLL